ncbi:unnamed protein product [Protopolystoma xenopodis]|uniref:Ig-like domain-containing protein n=1 Tax=Protopolystoma xenopodis TaxID=117903 RepID=A0A448WMS7_9PLAT|nr:unnamed protein product [Protopolystoma xenopodis]
MKPVTVAWQLNGQDLVTSEKTETSYIEETGLAHLIIRRASHMDSGEYTCLVTGDIIEPISGRRISRTIISSSSVLIEQFRIIS